MLKLKRILAVALGAVALTGLAGCTSVEDLKETPNAVIRTEYNGWTGESAFQYVDSDRQLKDLPVCGHPSIFDNYYCETEDGSVHFSYTVSKGAIYNGVLTVNGREIDLSCSTLEGMEYQGCIPNS